MRIQGPSLVRFAAEIGFTLSRKSGRLASIVETTRWTGHESHRAIRLVERTDQGIELTYNLSEPRNHSYVANGVVVRNCGEFLSVNNGACNLASINLMQYLDDDRFDVDAFKHTVELVFTAQEILVGRADYPTERITQNSHDFRQLGLGYTNLGAMLMALGLPYDSVAGRGMGGGDHLAHDRPRLRHQCQDGGPTRTVRRLRRERGAHAPRPAHAP